MGGGGGDLATYGRRAGATLLDGVIIGVVVFALALVAGQAGGLEITTRGIVIAATLLRSLLYAPILMCRGGARNGQTVGKQVLAIRVVRQDAAPIAAGSALLREFVGKGLLGLIPFYMIVDYLFPLGDARRQAIHDKIAGTFVVRADAVPDLDRVAADPFGASGPERPAVTSDWQPPSTPSVDPPTPAAEPTGSQWAPPAPAPAPPPAADSDDEVRGPFGPSSSEPR